MQINNLCKIQRKYSSGADTGIPVMTNDIWAVLARYDDCFEFRDFLLFKLCDIMYCEGCTESAYLNHVASRLHLSAPKISFVLADNMADIVLLNGWIADKALIGLYKCKDNEARIYIGSVLSTTNKSLMLKEIDNESMVDGVFRHYYKSISAISFCDEYAEMLQTMLDSGD